MKELEKLVSEEAKHRVARVLTARGTHTSSRPLDSAEIHDQRKITTLAAQKDTEHGEADYTKFMKLRCAELMFEFSRAANIAAEHGDVERMRAYETLAELIRSPTQAVKDYLSTKEPSLKDLAEPRYEHLFLKQA